MFWQLSNQISFSSVDYTVAGEGEAEASLPEDTAAGQPTTEEVAEVYAPPPAMPPPAAPAPAAPTIHAAPPAPLR